MVELKHELTCMLLRFIYSFSYHYVEMVRFVWMEERKLLSLVQKSHLGSSFSVKRPGIPFSIPSTIHTLDNSVKRYTNKTKIYRESVSSIGGIL